MIILQNLKHVLLHTYLYDLLLCKHYANITLSSFLILKGNPFDWTPLDAVLHSLGDSNSVQLIFNFLVDFCYS